MRRSSFVQAVHFWYHPSVCSVASLRTICVMRNAIVVKKMRYHSYDDSCLGPILVISSRNKGSRDSYSLYGRSFGWIFRFRA